MNALKKMDRFAGIIDEDIAFLVQENYSDYTKKATCVSVVLFQTYLQEKSYVRISFLYNRKS